MRWLLLSFTIIIYGCKHKVDIDNFSGYIADAGNTRVLLEELESDWAGGGITQKLSIIRNEYVIHEKLLNTPEEDYFIVDTIIPGKPNLFLLKRLSFLDSPIKKKGTLFVDDEIHVSYSIVTLKSSFISFVDSCFQVEYAENNILFFSEKKKEWIAFPRYKINILSPSEIELNPSPILSTSIEMRMDEKLARELISNLVKGQ